MESEKQMQYRKIWTNSELINVDESIWSTLIFIKIIGSDALWFPSPPARGPLNKNEKYHPTTLKLETDSTCLYEW